LSANAEAVGRNRCLSFGNAVHLAGLIDNEILQGLGIVVAQIRVCTSLIAWFPEEPKGGSA
jgi:hypothetical protein